MEALFRRVRMKYDVKKAKAIRLDNSTLFDIHKLSEYKEVDRNLEAYKAEQQAAANGRQKNVFDEWAETIGDYADSANSYDMGTQTNCTAYGNNVTCQTF